MLRRSRKRRVVSIPRNKWQVTNITIQQHIGNEALQDPHGHQDFIIVPSVATYGVRKVKNFKIECLNQSCTYTPQGGAPTPSYAGLLLVLVYIPEGTHPSSLHWSSAGSIDELYKPEQNVIATALVPTQFNKSITFTSLARNLNAGDAIYLNVLTNDFLRDGVTSITADFTLTVSYAISFN